jgi:hypothetical protein
MLSMQTTSPIRRYVLLRHRGDAAASRWSMERIAPAPRAGTHASAAAQPAKSARGRA